MIVKRNALAKAVNFALVSGVVAASFSSASYAAEEAATKVERIEVTGSRIKRTDMETPVPVTL
ncbi:hypothetical protein L9G16_20760, partial [Shewanella sp. A25]|nr:hypothetical protein [Shewanella shenzhenensis]